MAEATADSGKTVQDLIAQRNHANSAIDEALMALRRDIEHLRAENEELLSRLMVLEAISGRAPVHLVSPALSAPRCVAPTTVDRRTHR